jgi:hypothetical protein
MSIEWHSDGVMEWFMANIILFYICFLFLLFVQLRSIVAEWILDLGEYFDLHTTTSHAAISYLDRIQPNEKFVTFQWQMVAISCITVAAKYNEMEEDVPDLYTLGSIIEQDIPYKVALDYELWVLKQMGWKLNARTPLAFLSCYTCIGVVSPAEVEALALGGGGAEFKEINTMVVKHASILANLCILDMKFKAYPASLVAAAILFLSRRNVGLEDAWRQDLSELTNSDPVSFMHIVGELESAASDILARLQHLTAQRQANARGRALATTSYSGPQLTVETGNSVDITPTHPKASSSGRHKASPDSVANMIY